MPSVDIVIPIATHHQDIAERAIASAQAQTVACSVVAIIDTDREGPAVIRNRAVAASTADFVVFLDADDWIESDFVERCLQAWQPGGYVYTNWRIGDAVVTATQKPWCNGDWHVITILVPTVIAQAHPFDTTLPGAEDTDFFWSMTRHGVRPIHLDKPLFHYGGDGQRSRAFVAGPHYESVMYTIRQRYQHLSAYCGDDRIVGTPFDDAVTAVALWSGNRQQRGRISGRLYPRAGNGARMWVHRDDVNAQPDLWHAVQGGVQVKQTKRMHGIQEIASLLFSDPAHVMQSIIIDVPDVDIKPDIEGVLARYEQS